MQALLLIDIQKGLDDWNYYGGQRNNLNAEANAALLLSKFRKKEWPVFHVRHSSLNPDSPLYASKPGFQIKDEVRPKVGEAVITKNVNSAFIGTDLFERLNELEIKKIVIVGLTSQHCISTSVRMAANLGFEVFLAEDACAAFAQKDTKGVLLGAELVHQVTMANLNHEFAQILNTQKVLKSLDQLGG